MAERRRDDEDEDMDTLAEAGGGTLPPVRGGSDSGAEPPTAEVPATELPTTDVDLARGEATIAGPMPVRGGPPPEATVEDLSRASREDMETLASVPVHPDPEEPAEDDDRATILEDPTAEIPTMEIGRGRDTETHAGGFGTRPIGSRRGEDDATLAPGSGDGDDDEGATIVEGQSGPQRPGSTEHRTTGPARPGASRTPHPTHADPGAASATQRTQGPVPASKYSRGTARDPVAQSSASRTTGPVPRSLPTQLAEGLLLADRYELVRRLGKGGMGEVWQAKHTLLQGMRAIKVIKASISRDPGFRARFLSEGQTMMRVKHAGIVEVTDLDETRSNRELFMVMEYLQGRTMHDAIRSDEQRLGADLRDTMRIYRELALGMQRIHDERIVHKDLKTDNVLLVRGEDGLEHPKVIDFGLAKRLDATEDVPVAQGAAAAASGADADTKTTLSGTLAYMAPEQFRAEPSSFQSDLYAYGVMLYECFTKGEYPMPRGSLMDYVKRHMSGEVPQRLRQARPDLDPFVTELADVCMAPRREQRPVSFQEVADKIDYWLKAPERRAARNRLLLMTGAAAGLVGTAIWGVLSAKEWATVNDPSFLSGSTALERSANGFHLGEGALAALSLDAKVSEGDVDRPVLEVDGRPFPADLAIEGGRVRTTKPLDLSGLSDGAHRIVLRVGPKGGAELAVVADRVPPTISGVRLAEGEGNVTNAPAPALLVSLADATAAVRRVTAWVGAEKVTAEPADGVWRVTGLAKREGETRVRLVAEDLAGNLSAPQEFAFTWDRRAPDLRVVSADLLGDVLQVRSASGGTFRVSTDEPVELSVQAAGRAARAFPRGTAFEVPLADLSAEGLPVRVVAADAAGNRSESAFTARIVEDIVTLRTQDGRDEIAVKGDSDVVLAIERSYPLPPSGEIHVLAARTLGRDGTPDAAPPRELAAAEIDRDPTDPRRATISIPSGTLPGAGRYTVSLSGVEGARISHLTLFADADRPIVARTAVTDAEGRAVPDGTWARTREVVVTAEVSDLALASLELDGKPPAEPLRDGVGTYTFRVTCPREGSVPFALSAKDRSGNSTEQTVTVRADWSDPQLTLAGPNSGGAFDDVKPVDFTGTCSEDEYTLFVEGDAEVGRRPFAQTTASFVASLQLPKGERSLTVYAEDRAGRRSAPVPLRLTVKHVARELPPQIEWQGGVRSVMRKVTAGAEVVEGRTHPVAEFFLDRTEVTNAQYRAFLAASEPYAGKKAPWDHPEQPAGWSHVPPAETWKDARFNGDDQPVVNVAWWDAWAFAAWSGRRLPREAEWVKAAARSADAAETELRQWPPIAAGTPWKEGLLVVSDGKRLSAPASAVAGGDLSPVDCLHMGGNVSEWVDLPFAQPGEERTGVRGGNWNVSRFAADVRRTPTKRYERSVRYPTIGFRCAVDAENVSP